MVRQRFAKPLFPGSNPGGASKNLYSKIMGLNKGVVIQRTFLTEDVLDLSIKPATEFDFKAGQFITVKIADGGGPCFRAYSIASPPSQKDQIDLCIKIVPGGRGGAYFKDLNINDEIDFIGPSGHFTLQNQHDKTTYFIATGTGLAPFNSMIEEELAQNSQAKMHLIFGVRHEKDLFCIEKFQWFADNHPNFTFQATLSQPEDSWTGEKGRVTHILENTTFDAPNSQAYICGLKDMIDAVRAILEQKGLPKDQIHFEKYD